jgi:methionyl-tRNA formyltransferase
LEENILHLAGIHNIPVWQVGSLSDAQTAALFLDLQPDLMVVACFPYIFPAELLQLPQHGCLNLHPSLLPAYRGPAPLFWIARNDEQITGVTLHFLDEGLDSGDIVAQTQIERVEGMTETALDRCCAEEGAELLLSAVRQLGQGQRLPRQPQPEVGASYFPWPGETDLIIPIDWPARRAFNFVRGAENWPLVIKFDDAQFCIRIAISYALDQMLDQPYVLLGDELWVQFQPGVLRAKLF